jgi:flagellar hook-associated protein 2
MITEINIYPAHNLSMTITKPTAAPAFGGANNRLSDLYATATRTLLAQNPGLKTIDAQLRRDDARLSTLGKMALALDGFRTAAGSLSAAGLDMTASSSAKAVEARLTGAAPAAGTHTVEVKQLAQAQQLVSKTLPARDSALASAAATIKVESGAGSTTVRIDPANSTLDGIAKAMRDTGLDAQVVQDGKGFALSLTGLAGAANAMRINVSGDPVLQGLLSHGSGANSAMTQKTAAQDAQLLVDGKAVSAGGNKVDKAIAGVSLTLTATGKSEVKVARDPSAIAANVKNFVAAFNTMSGQLGALRSGDAASDSALNQVSSQIGQVLDGAGSKALAEMGISRKNGGLALDEAKLKAAIALDPERVMGLFTKPGSGLAEQLAKRAGQQIASGGAVANQAVAVQQEVDKLTDKKTKITDAVSRQAAAMAQQYALAAAGGGGNSLFGYGQVKPMSAFDYLA